MLPEVVAEEEEAVAEVEVKAITEEAVTAVELELKFVAAVAMRVVTLFVDEKHPASDPARHDC